MTVSNQGSSPFALFVCRTAELKVDIFQNNIRKRLVITLKSVLSTYSKTRAGVLVYKQHIKTDSQLICLHKLQHISSIYTTEIYIHPDTQWLREQILKR